MKITGVLVKWSFPGPSWTELIRASEDKPRDSTFKAYSLGYPYVH